MSDTGEARRRAVAFVQQHGDERARLRAEVLVGQQTPSALVDLLAARQGEDGGFASDGGQAAIDATRGVLSELGDLGVVGGPVVEGICAWLRGVQSADGEWGEGAEEERIFQTGLLLGHLARTPCARASMLDAAADWLAERFSPERVQGFAWRAVAAYAAAFANLQHEDADGILQWCGRELERGFRAERFDGLRTARVLTWCDARSLPGSRLDPAEVVARLLAEQADDGGWPADPVEERVEWSLAALVALLRFS